MDWSKHLEKCVRLEGYALAQKIGPVLVGPQYSVGVILDGDDWPRELMGRHVRVEGVVAERSDLPVFVPKKGEPMEQGIPVPESTNLEEARRRYVLEKVSVQQVRSERQVAEALEAQRGQVVTLTGILWSRNGHWWFAHEGVDMHVDDITSAPGWSADLHGRPVALRGRLDRAMLPRIDQIALKPERDLAEAYQLTGVTLEPHPTWRPVPCGP